MSALPLVNRKKLVALAKDLESGRINESEYDYQVGKILGLVDPLPRNPDVEAAFEEQRRPDHVSRTDKE